MIGYLAITGAVAFVVYEKAGLDLLRRAWVNLDLVWAVALIVTAGVALAMPGLRTLRRLELADNI
jgi:hypothetical protein